MSKHLIYPLAEHQTVESAEKASSVICNTMHDLCHHVPDESLDATEARCHAATISDTSSKQRAAAACSTCPNRPVERTATEAALLCLAAAHNQLGRKQRRSIPPINPTSGGVNQTQTNLFRWCQWVPPVSNIIKNLLDPHSLLTFQEANR